MAKAICSGDLRTTLSIQERVDVDDGAGGYETSWVEIFPLRCALKFKAGRESFIHDGVAGTRNWEATARWVPGVTSIHRAVYGNRIFNIRYVVNVDERSLWMKLQMEELVQD